MRVIFCMSARMGCSALRAASSVGALATALFVSWRPVGQHVGAKMLWAVGVYGVFTVVFGLSTSFWLSAFCLALLGAADMVSVLIRQTLMQVSTPDEMRGRVGAISTLFISASNELGEMESGIAAALMGLARGGVRRGGLYRDRGGMGSAVPGAAGRGRISQQTGCLITVNDRTVANGSAIMDTGRQRTFCQGANHVLCHHGRLSDRRPAPHQRQQLYRHRGRHRQGAGW
jgi:hypothetical protein